VDDIPSIESESVNTTLIEDKNLEEETTKVNQVEEV
jgi:hypothetical protein